MIRRRDLLGGLASSFAMPAIARALPASQFVNLMGKVPGATVTPWVGPLVLDSRLSSEGDSITAGSNGPMWSEFSMMAEGGSNFRPNGWNNAVGGTTTVQMLARQTAFLATKPRAATFLGGTNDLTGYPTDTPAIIAARIQQWIANCFAANVQYVVICKVLPRNDATWLALSASRQNDRLLLNQIIATFAVPGKVFVVDLESTFNPTTMTGEGLHPNYIGAPLLGYGFASGLTSFTTPGLDPLAIFNTSGNILFAGGMNPQLAGTTGTPTPSNLVTGQVATLWSIQTNDTTLTAVCSKVLAPDGVTAAQRIVVSGTCTTAGRVVTMSRSAPYNGQPGQQYEAAVGFSLATGATGLRALYISCDTGQSMNSTQTGNMDGTQAYTGVLRAPPNTPLTVVDTSMNTQLVMGFNAGTVAADITFWKPWVRQVPTP